MKTITNTFFLIIICSVLATGQQKPIEVEYIIHPDNSVEFKYTKFNPGSYTLYLEFINLTNAHPKKLEKVLHNRSGTLCKLRPLDPKTPIRFSYTYNHHRGEIDPKIDLDHHYLLPFRKGKQVYVYDVQNLNEKYFNDNSKAKDWQAYQLEIASKDTVYAIRKGTVIELQDQYQVDTSKAFSFYRNTNMIKIEHEDGTYAIYRGFEKGEIFVDEGEIVYPQIPLGVIGRHDKREEFRLTLMLYYYTKDPSNDYIRQGIKIKGSVSTFITPYFITKEGIIQLEPGQVYTSTYNDEQIIEEMSRRERKKWKQKKK